MPPLHHAIFTHAGSAGFRDVFIAPDWPRHEKERLSRWLRGLRPRYDDSPALATASFRLGDDIHAALARVDATVRDEHGRPGLFVHALLVPVTEDGMPGLFEAALLTLTRRLRKDDAGSERYFLRCQKRRDVKIPDGPGKILDVLFTERFFNAARLLRPTRSCELAAPQRPDALPRLLASASACLPPRLRLASPWAVGLHSTQLPAVLARTADSHERYAPELTFEGMDYAKWLLAHGTADLAGDWQIRSWDDLVKRVRRRA